MGTDTVSFKLVWCWPWVMACTKCLVMECRKRMSFLVPNLCISHGDEENYHGRGQEKGIAIPSVCQGGRAAMMGIATKPYSWIWGVKCCFH